MPRPRSHARAAELKHQRQQRYRERQQNRAPRRKRFQGFRATFRGFKSTGATYRQRIREALSAATTVPALTFNRGRGPESLSVDDLACALFVIERSPRGSVAYNAFRSAYRYAGLPYHRAKIPAAKRALSALGLIVKLANHANFPNAKRGETWGVVGVQSENHAHRIIQGRRRLLRMMFETIRARDAAIREACSIQGRIIAEFAPPIPPEEETPF